MVPWGIRVLTPVATIEEDRCFASSYEYVSKFKRPCPADLHLSERGEISVRRRDNVTLQTSSVATPRRCAPPFLILFYFIFLSTNLSFFFPFHPWSWGRDPATIHCEAYHVEQFVFGVACNLQLQNRRARSFYFHTHWCTSETIARNAKKGKMKSNEWKTTTKLGTNTI